MVSTECTLTVIGSLPMQSTKTYVYSKRKTGPLFLAGTAPLSSTPSLAVKARRPTAAWDGATLHPALTEGDGAELRGAVPARNRGPVLRLE